jgi:hypothetical protein
MVYEQSSFYIVIKSIIITTLVSLNHEYLMIFFFFLLSLALYLCTVDFGIFLLCIMSTGVIL